MPSFLYCTGRNLYSLGLISVLLRTALILRISIVLCGRKNMEQRNKKAPEKRNATRDSTPSFIKRSFIKKPNNPLLLNKQKTVSE